MNQEQKNPDMDLIPVTELKDYQRAVVVKSPKYLPLEGKRIQCWKHSIVSFNEGDDWTDIKEPIRWDDEILVMVIPFSPFLDGLQVGDEFVCETPSYVALQGMTMRVSSLGLSNQNGILSVDVSSGDEIVINLNDEDLKLRFTKRSVSDGQYRMTVTGENVPSVKELKAEWKKSIDDPNYSIILPCEVKIEKIQKIENGVLVFVEESDIVDGTFEIPECITSIGDDCFSCLTSLETITIPNQITSIASFAFWNCKNLKEIVITSKNTIIGELAFFQCPSIATVNGEQCKNFDGPLLIVTSEVKIGDVIINGGFIVEDINKSNPQVLFVAEKNGETSWGTTQEQALSELELSKSKEEPIKG